MDEEALFVFVFGDDPVEAFDSAELTRGWLRPRLQRLFWKDAVKSLRGSLAHAIR